MEEHPFVCQQFLISPLLPSFPFLVSPQTYQMQMAEARRAHLAEQEALNGPTEQGQVKGKKKKLIKPTAASGKPLTIAK
jgi:hypothetical protein